MIYNRLSLNFLVVLTVVFQAVLCRLEAVAQKSRICLNMIVKNESHVIQRSLSSVRDLIDYWVIVDTGSSDGTQGVICKSLEGIPGELYERPWINFGANRTEALELARGKGDYILFLDADDWLEIDPSLVLHSLSEDVYWARWQSLHVPSFSYMKPLMVKDSLPCAWKGVIHEYLCCELANSHETLNGVTYVFTGEGNRSKNPKKYLLAARDLENALIEEPDNARYMFYLAESYRDADCLENALNAYLKRIRMGGWEEEILWSWLQVGHLRKTLCYPYEDVLHAYLRAHYQNPTRAEPIYFISELYNQHQDFSLAYDLIKQWSSLPSSDHHHPFFKLEWIEDYGIKFQLSMSSFYLHHYEESLDLHDQLLANPNLPQRLREQVLLNRLFPLNRLRSNR